MDPPPTRDREVLEPETRAFPDADDPETSRSESDEGIPPPPPPPPLRQQLMGACRADERLRPLLTLNVSCAAADDRFIAHLAQHFEVSEINADGVKRNFYPGDKLPLWHDELEPHNSLLDILPDRSD